MYLLRNNFEMLDWKRHLSCLLLPSSCPVREGVVVVVLLVVESFKNSVHPSSVLCFIIIRCFLSGDSLELQQ